MNCIFCKSETNFSTKKYYFGRVSGIVCPICGEYFLSPDLIHHFELNEIPNDDFKKTAHLLAENKIREQTAILLKLESDLNDSGLNEISFSAFLDLYPKDGKELFNRSFFCLASRLEHPAAIIALNALNEHQMFARNYDDVLYFIDQFKEAGYIKPKGTGTNLFRVVAHGWEYYEELKKKPLGHSTQVFVAMWFDESRRVFYEQGIKPAIEEATNYKCIRVDAVQHNNKICDQIIAEIRKSKFMVSDFTGDRSGVYYEAGFAQGLGIPVIWVVDETDVKNLHFDTRQYNHITYKDAEELRAKLRARIEATIV